MEAKIAEIICTHCKSGSTCDQRYCDETNAMIKAILALIAADRAELVEALEYSKHKFQELKDAKMLNTTRIIAKIDKALEVK